MSKMKKFAACGLIFALSLSVAGCGNEGKVDNAPTSSPVATSSPTASTEAVEDVPIAKVGDVEIMRSELDLQLGYQTMMLTLQYGEDFATSEQGVAYLTELKTYIVDNLINSQVALQKAKELGLECSEEEVETEFNKEKANYETEEAFNEALAGSNMTQESLKEEIRDSLTLQKVIAFMGEEATVTDEEVEKYYNDNIASYTTGPGAEMAHILVATEEEAKTVKAEYTAGTSFEDLAAKYGTDGTKDVGGSLGFIPYDSTSYDADFLAGAKALKEGEVSEPVKTQFGWHLIKVTGVTTETVVQPLEEVKEEVKEKVLAEKKNTLVNDKLTVWKAEANIEKFEDAINK